MRRVVITGIGIISPLAANREASWERLIAGESGAGPIDTFDPENTACKIAFQVPYKDGRGGGSEDDPHANDPDAVATAKERRRIDEFVLYAIGAADEAVQDSGWVAETDEDKERTGVLIGAGIGVLFRRYWWAFGVAAVLGAGIMLLLPFRFITDEMTLAQQVAMDSVACALVCLIVQGVARRLLTREAA